ncbi:MAG: TVP38/TMEM64 family protein [Bacteroidia bacterium]|nr:TVP38/TMEM64 family protein [Bacteroidia bacterium]
MNKQSNQINNSKAGKHKRKIKKSILPGIFSAVLLGGLVLAYFFVPAFQRVVQEGYRVFASGERQQISQWVQQFGFWGPVLIVVGMTAQMFLVVVPSILLIIVSVLAYGPWWGSLYSVIAVAVASSIAYAIGYGASKAFVNRLIGPEAQEKFLKAVKEYGMLGVVVVARINPLLSNDAVSFISGLVKLNFWKFMAATLGGVIPLIALAGFLGANMQRLETGMWWISGIAIVGFVVFYFYRRQKKRD